MRTRLFWPSLPLLLLGCGLSPMDQERLNTYFANAQDFYSRGRYPNAEHQARQALRLDEDDHKANLLLAWALLKQDTPQKLLQAEAQFERCLDFWWTTDDHQYKAHLGLATAQLRHATLLQDREERLAKAPNVDEREIQRLQETKNRLFERAVEHLLEVLELNPDNPMAINFLGQARYLQKRYDEAVLHFERYLDLARTSRDFFERRLQLGDSSLDQEREVLEKIDRNYEKERHVRSALANIYYRTGEYDKALDNLNILLAIEPSASEEYYNRAKVLSAMGRLDEACADMKTFIARTDLPYDSTKVREAYALLEARGVPASTPHSDASTR